MKFIPLVVTASAALVAANPVPAAEAATASIDDVATVGFASTNGGTTGGKGGTTTTVSSLAAFTAAVSGDDAAVVVVSGAISGAAQVRVGSNKSIIGKDSSAKLEGVGLYINKVKNVIVRNLAISKVLADNGDAIGIQASTNVWIDHNDLSSDLDHDKDYYDGLLDVTHACDWVTLSNNYLHDHWKASLVGHSDNNGDEDTGHLTVTYVGNMWHNINSRTPSLRFGTGHVYNSYFQNVSDGINTRDGAQVLVQSNVFDTVKKPEYSTDDGYAVNSGNTLVNCDADLEAETGTISASSLPYTFTVADVGTVEASVKANAGQTLSF